MVDWILSRKSQQPLPLPSWSPSSPRHHFGNTSTTGFQCAIGRSRSRESVGAASSFLTTPFPHTAGHHCDGGNAGPAEIPGGAACLVDTDVLVSWTRSIQLARELVIARQQRALNLGIKTAADEMTSLSVLEAYQYRRHQATRPLCLRR